MCDKRTRDFKGFVRLFLKNKIIEKPDYVDRYGNLDETVSSNKRQFKQAAFCSVHISLPTEVIFSIYHHGGVKD